MRRRPEVTDKPCRNFQALGVTECQCPRIAVPFVFHPKCSKSLCRIRYCSTWRQLPAPWDTHLQESNAICPDATYMHLPFRQRTALLKPCQRNLRHMASFHSFHMAYVNRLSVHEFKIRSAHMGYAVEYLIYASPVWLQTLFFTTPPEETNPDFPSIGSVAPLRLGRIIPFPMAPVWFFRCDLWGASANRATTAKSRAFR